MRTQIQKLLFVFMALALIIPPQTATAADMSKEDIQTIIKDYLMENPEVIMQSVEAYRKKQEEEMRTGAQEQIKANMGKLTSADAPSAGNPDADVTIVEFFDYNCGYCKRALPDLQALLKEDKNVRVVFREMPILSPASRVAAQWALAAHKQGKYFEYHSALMTSPGRKDESGLADLAKKLGLDVEQMKKDAAGPEVAAMLEADMTLARQIGVQGTPAFIVNGEFFPGYIGKEGLKQSIESARKKGDNNEG